MNAARLSRGQTQRIMYMGHTISPDPRVQIDIMGTSGNPYQVVVTLGEISCTCMDYNNQVLRNQSRNYPGVPRCKHVYHVLSKIMRMPDNRCDENPDQSFIDACIAALENTPVHCTNPSPTLPTSRVDQRPWIGHDCAICCDVMDAEENVVYCASQCGQSVHASCHKQFKKHCRSKTLTCVYCRTPWV